MATIEIRDVLDNETGETIFPRTHVKAVIGLADSNFFEEYTDGNGVRSVRLRSEFAGLWAEGWISGAGINNGAGGGGGGGLINGVYGASSLGSIYSPTGTEDLTKTFSAFAIDKVWQSVLALQQSTPNVSLVNGANNSTLTVNGTTADFYTKAQVDGLIGGIHNWEPVPVVTLPTASASTMYKLYLVPSEDPQTQNVRDEYITIRSGSVGSYTYSWEQIGSTAIDLSGYVTTQQLGSWAGSSNITTLGTITTGTWSGTTIGVTKGGTGLTSISKGSMLYASASNTISALSANGTTTKKFLSQTSDNAPSWAVPALSDISGTDDLQAIEELTGTSGLLKKTAANTWTLDATSYLPSGTTLDSIADGSARKLADYLPLSGGTITGNLTVNGTASFGSTVGVSDAISLVGTTAAKRRIYFGDSTHYVELDDNGFHFSHGVYSDGYVASGGIGASSGSGSATELGDLVDVSLTSRSNGDLLVYNSATSHWENKPQSSIIPSVSIGFNDLTSHPTTISGYGITDAYTKTEVDGLISGIDLSDYALKTGANNYNFRVNTLLIGSGTLKEDRHSGALPPARPRPKWDYEFQDTSVFPWVTYTGSEWLAYLSDIPSTLPNPRALTFGSKTYDGTLAKEILASDLGALTQHQSVTLASGTNNGTLKLTTAAGTVDNIAVKGLQALAYKASLLASDIPDISGTYVTLAGAQTVTGAKTFAADLTLSENLVMGAAKHIDIGPARIEYDATTGAIHVTTNQTGNNAPTIGFYVDGFNAAGGAGTNGGGGGYGVESITSNQDGTVDFHFTGGDVTTVDLNHEHPQYPKYVHLASESEMPANPDPNTMYIIDGSGGGGGGSYTLPIASASTLGGIKVGDGLSIDGNTGVLSTVSKIVYLTSESQMPASPDANTLYVILES